MNIAQTLSQELENGLKAMEGTRVYGSSDDNICFDGEFTGEVGCYGTERKEHGVLVVFNDGTLLEVKYGKNDRGCWGISLVVAGSKFIGIDQCPVDDDQNYSDIATFKPGIKWAYAATEWERVK